MFICVFMCLRQAGLLGCEAVLSSMALMQASSPPSHKKMTSPLSQNHNHSHNQEAHSHHSHMVLPSGVSCSPMVRTKQAREATKTPKLDRLIDGLIQRQTETQKINTAKTSSKSEGTATKSTHNTPPISQSCLVSCSSLTRTGTSTLHGCWRRRTCSWASMCSRRRRTGNQEHRPK